MEDLATGAVSKILFNPHGQLQQTLQLQRRAALSTHALRVTNGVVGLQIQ